MELWQKVGFVISQYYHGHAHPRYRRESVFADLIRSHPFNSVKMQVGDAAFWIRSFVTLTQSFCANSSGMGEAPTARGRTMSIPDTFTRR